MLVDFMALGLLVAFAAPWIGIGIYILLLEFNILE